MLDDIAGLAKKVLLVIFIVFIIANYGHSIGAFLHQFEIGLKGMSAGMNGN